MEYNFKGEYKNKYELIKKIGRGQYTEVYKAKNKKTKELKAIKIIKLDDIREQIEKENIPENVSQKLKDYINCIKNEILNMEICSENNENSVKFYESFESENEFAIVLELCDDSLTKFLLKKKECFSSKEINEIINQLNNTFKIMKEKKIVHRDLKPDNILIKYEKNKYIAKICDYGISKIGSFTHLNTHTGTTYYMAPEIMELTEENNYNYKCDLWSLGIIIYELFFKERPYKGITEHAILEEIKNFGKKRLKKTGDLNLDDLISKLLEKDPEKRLTWEKYFNHPFFNEITIIYNKKFIFGNQIKIFGSDFVKNNFSICKIIYKGKYYNLKEYFEIKKDEEFLEIKLNGIINSTNISYMFSNCNSLELIKDISKWNFINIIDMSGMFYECSSLKSLPDISLLDTSNVKYMIEMFRNCSSLKTLPDISKWNVKNVKNMSGMFRFCESLEFLPDISKWKINNLTDISDIFNYCVSLQSLPDISKWTTNNVSKMSGIFYYCKSLQSLPDISNWNTNNVIDMSGMFYYCESLISLPDISKWDMKSVTNISYMFRQCKSLKYLPDISKWKINNISNMSELFYHCDSLESLPNISKWNANNITDINNMFSFCNSLKSIPDLSEWNISKAADTSDMFYGVNNFIKCKSIFF